MLGLVAPKVSPVFQTIRKKCLHCCGSMQIDATCWYQQCCVFRAFSDWFTQGIFYPLHHRARQALEKLVSFFLLSLRELGRNKNWQNGFICCAYAFGLVADMSQVCNPFNCGVIPLSRTYTVEKRHGFRRAYQSRWSSRWMTGSVTYFQFKWSNYR